MPKTLAIQDYLRSGKTLDDLASEFAIRVVRHPSLPLVALKYSQLDSPKAHPIVRDCRGLTLEVDTWDVVGLPLRRFFNAGEVAEEFARFDWTDFETMTKEDGSLIILYHYQGAWHANTSGSFGLGECGFSGKSWGDLFWETSGIDRDRLIPEWTYIFEMWTPHNKVVRSYAKPTTFLLAVTDPANLLELPTMMADKEAEELGVPRPERHDFRSMAEIAGFLEGREAADPTFEGVVVRDRNGQRWKIKSRTYLSLHHLVDNGNLYNPRRLVPLVLAGEVDEVVVVMPEIREAVEETRDRVDRAYAEAAAVWEAYQGIKDQGDFARAIRGKTPFTGLLFSARKALGGPSKGGDEVLRGLWRKSPELVTKALYS